MNQFLSKVIDMMTIDNSSLKTIIALLPEEQQQNAVEILMGTAPVVTLGTFYTQKNVNRNVINSFELVDYNPLTRMYLMQYYTYKEVYAYIPFERDSEEYKQLEQQIASMSYNEAKELISAFSGSKGYYFNTAETQMNSNTYDHVRVVRDFVEIEI